MIRWWLCLDHQSFCDHLSWISWQFLTLIMSLQSPECHEALFWSLTIMINVALGDNLTILLITINIYKLSQSSHPLTLPPTMANIFSRDNSVSCSLHAWVLGQVNMLVRTVVAGVRQWKEKWRMDHAAVRMSRDNGSAEFLQNYLEATKLKIFWSDPRKIFECWVLTTHDLQQVGKMWLT